MTTGTGKDSALAVGPVSPDVVRRYAEAARDPNPIHLDDTFARGIGLPGAVVHGMWIMGQLERAIRARAPAHEVEAFTVRFTKPVLVGATLTLQTRIAQASPPDDGRVRTLLRIVASADGALACMGTAAVLGPPLEAP